jgi:hypothetical protein
MMHHMQADESRVQVPVGIDKLLIDLRSRHSITKIV